jgi:hypothetical protein
LYFFAHFWPKNAGAARKIAQPPENTGNKQESALFFTTSKANIVEKSRFESNGIFL